METKGTLIQKNGKNFLGHIISKVDLENLTHTGNITAKTARRKMRANFLLTLFKGLVEQGQCVMV